MNVHNHPVEFKLYTGTKCNVENTKRFTGNKMSRFARFCGINSVFITLCRRMVPNVSCNGWLWRRMVPIASKGLNDLKKIIST